jgi:cyclopropane-fatty-acyl-phospholipid synthase
MFEHVGPKTTRTYMRKGASLLKDGGIFLLHTIGGTDIALRQMTRGSTSIFSPTACCPLSPKLPRRRSACLLWKTGITLAPTTTKRSPWFANFDRGWPEIGKNDKYSERFYRMWKYYLLVDARGFSARAAAVVANCAY